MRLEELLFRESKDYFYIMHLSYEGRERERLWDYARQNDIVGLSHSSVNEDYDRIRDSVRDDLSPIWRKRFDMFCDEMLLGDIVVILDGWNFLLGVARVIRGHSYEEELSEDFFDHVREVEWLRQYDFSKRPRMSHPVRGFLNTLYKVMRNTRRWRILSTIEV